MSDVRIEHLVTGGTISVQGNDVFIENNVFLVGNDSEVIVIDAAHDASAIATAVGDRQALGILLTHGHGDHVNAALDLKSRLDTNLYLHPADTFLWHHCHGDDATPPDFEIAHGQEFMVGEATLSTRHTPGHTPGSVCFVIPALNTVLTGDTLFRGGPGATRWEYSSFPQIIESIEEQLFTLDSEMAAMPGHGPGTTLREEHEQLQTYIDRGW